MENYFDLTTAIPTSRETSNKENLLQEKEN